MRGAYLATQIAAPTRGQLAVAASNTPGTSVAARRRMTKQTTTVTDFAVPSVPSVELARVAGAKGHPIRDAGIGRPITIGKPTDPKRVVQEAGEGAKTGAAIGRGLGAATRIPGASEVGAGVGAAAGAVYSGGREWFRQKTGN